MFRQPAAALFAVAALAAACDASAQSARVTYVDPFSYFTTDAQFDAWLTLRANLAADFDAICGDTFCEGDWSNITPLRLQCSVQRRSGRIGACVWSFAASNEDIDTVGGAVLADAGAWACRIPLAPATTIDALLQALDGDEPLYRPLPGGAASIYDALGDCL